MGTTGGTRLLLVVHLLPPHPTSWDLYTPTTSPSILASCVFQTAKHLGSPCSQTLPHHSQSLAEGVELVALGIGFLLPSPEGRHGRLDDYALCLAALVYMN